MIHGDVVRLVRMELKIWLIAEQVMPNNRPRSSLVSLKIFQTR